MSHAMASITVVLVRFVGIASQALIFIFLANRLPISDVGLFSGIYVFWGLVRMLGPLGLDQLAMRDIAAALARGERGPVEAITNFSVLFVGLAGLALALAAGAILLGAGRWSSHILPPQAVLAASLAVPAYALIGLLAGQLRGLGRNVSSQSIETLGLHWFALILLGALALDGSLALETALAAQAAAAWIVIVIYAAMRARCGIDIAQRMEKGERRKTIREALQIWQALFVTGMAVRAPTYVSLALLGPAATAILEIAIRFGTLPTIFTSGVSTTFSPVFAGHHAKNGREELCRSLTLSSWLAFLPSLAVLLGLAVLGPWLLGNFFPADYRAAFWPLLLVCAATTINAGFGLASVAFIMTGRQAFVRLYSIVQLLFIVLASAILAPLSGATGIAAAMLGGTILRDCGLARMLARDLGRQSLLAPSGLKDVIMTLRIGKS